MAKALICERWRRKRPCIFGRHCCYPGPGPLLLRIMQFTISCHSSLETHGSRTGEIDGSDQWTNKLHCGMLLLYGLRYRATRPEDIEVDGRSSATDRTPIIASAGLVIALIRLQQERAGRRVQARHGLHNLQTRPESARHHGVGSFSRRPQR